MTNVTEIPPHSSELPVAEDFQHAPDGWTPAYAATLAEAASLELSLDHWVLLAALQEYFARNAAKRIRVRDLHDALKEKFHTKGGGRYLYQLFPGGPVAQGCLMAGLEVPAGTVDRSYGSVG